MLPLLGPQKCSYCSQPGAKLGGAGEPYSCLQWGSFTARLAAGDPCSLRLSQRCMAISGSSFHSLVMPALCSQVSDLCHVWRSSLLRIPLPLIMFTGIFLQQISSISDCIMAPASWRIEITLTFSNPSFVNLCFLYSWHSVQSRYFLRASSRNP